jgi:hypothetical protein
VKNRHVLRAINLVRREQETRITCDLTRNTCYADTYETFETLHVPEVSPLLSCPFHLLYGISNFAPGNFSMIGHNDGKIVNPEARAREQGCRQEEHAGRQERIDD